MQIVPKLQIVRSPHKTDNHNYSSIFQAYRFLTASLCMQPTTDGVLGVHLIHMTVTKVLHPLYEEHCWHLDPSASSHVAHQSNTGHRLPPHANDRASHETWSDSATTV